MPAQYVLHNNEILRYMEYALYKLENTKIAFEYHRPIDSKLCHPIFNYFKFYPISQFVKYIWDYSHAINYNITHSEVAHKYLLKALYNMTIKNEYNLQI